MMENSSLSSDVTNDVTSSSPSLQSGDLMNIVLKAIHIFIGIVGIVDNLFVFIVFILFIKITDKVFQNVRKTQKCNKIPVLSVAVRS